MSMNKVALVDEGRALALGVGDASGRGLVEADALIFFDTSSWERIGDPVNLDPFWSMEESGDGVLTVGVACAPAGPHHAGCETPEQKFQWRWDVSENRRDSLERGHAPRC